MCKKKIIPKVSFDGRIKYCYSQDEKRILKEHGLDPEKGVIIRRDDKGMLIKVEGVYYFIEKEESHNG